MKKITSAQGACWLLVLFLTLGLTSIAGPPVLAQEAADTPATEQATDTATEDSAPEAAATDEPASDATATEEATTDETATAPTTPTTTPVDAAPGGPADGTAAAVQPGADATAAADTGPTGTDMLLTVLIVLATLVVPIALGVYLGGALRMPDHGWKIATALLAITAAIVIDFYGWPPQQGPDLSGGILLIYELEEVAEEEGVVRPPVDMNRMIGAIGRRVNPGGVKEVTIRQYGPQQIEIIIPRAGDDEIDQVMRRISSSGSLEFRITANTVDHPDIIGRAQASQSRLVRDGDRTVARWVELDTNQIPVTSTDYIIRTDVRGPEVLIMQDLLNVTGEYLSSSLASFDDVGSRAVSFNFNASGANRFGQLTGANLPIQATGFFRHLGIVLDDKLISAPQLRSQIGARGQITGDYTEEEVEFMISILNAGSLPVALAKQPISRQTISPTLGADMIRQGSNAIMISMAAVLVFMLIYYRFAGLVACLALMANLVLVLAVMISIKAAFTLPGLAGFVLTVGMAVDANVLIFERIREELARGAALRMAIRNGFARATTTIVDANVTTLITAIVLYMNRNEQIRGFAVPLILGIVMSMFTAIFCSRIIFDIAEKRGWLTRLNMMQIIGHTKIDFIGKSRLAGAVSAILIAIGLVGVYARGSDLFDIDFTGGTSVTMVFRDDAAKPIEVVRAAVTDQEGFDSVAVVGLDEVNLQYKVNTSNRDFQAVQDRLQEIFDEDLRTYSLTFSDVTEIAEGDTTESSVLAGGSSVRLTFGEDVKHDTVSERVTVALDESGLSDQLFELSNPNHRSGSEQRFSQWDMRISLDTQETERALTTLAAQLTDTPVFPSSNQIGGRVAGDTQAQAAGFLFASLLCMVGYIWIRFQRVMYGLAAVVALVHDVLITLGMIAMSAYLVSFVTPLADVLLVNEFKISLPIVAAFLTIIGYSLNDTIVVFDRIREVRGKSPNLSAEMINTSLNQTLSRTLLTSLTTLIVVAILFSVGGQGIHGFAFALVIGVMAGTYSSIFIASPVLLWMSEASQPPPKRRKTAEVAKV